MKFQDRVYTFGDKVQFSDDSVHIFDPNFSLQDIRNGEKNKLFCYICGLLNSTGGGTIYLGIDENKVVKGFAMTEKDIDKF